MPDESSDNVAGLGNFKGVMLCNRPDNYDGRLKDPSEFPPFYASIAQGALEPPGLLHKTRYDPQKKRREVPPAIKKHKEWIKQYHDEYKKAKAGEEGEEQKKKSRFHATRERCAVQREEVRHIVEEAEEQNVDKNDVDFMNRLMDAVEGDITITSPAKSKKKKETKGKKKPAWACKNEEEIEEIEEQDAEDLIEFASNLNFASYIDDIEFREALLALKGRAGVLKKRKIF